MPDGLASLMTERILVPKMLRFAARSSRDSRSGMGFINCTPSRKGSRPLSTLRMGTIFFWFQR